MNNHEMQNSFWRTFMEDREAREGIQTTTWHGRGWFRFDMEECQRLPLAEKIIHRPF